MLVYWLTPLAFSENENWFQSRKLFQEWWRITSETSVRFSRESDNWWSRHSPEVKSILSLNDRLANNFATSSSKLSSASRFPPGSFSGGGNALNGMWPEWLWSTTKCASAWSKESSWACAGAKTKKKVKRTAKQEPKTTSKWNGDLCFFLWLLPCLIDLTNLNTIFPDKKIVISIDWIGRLQLILSLYAIPHRCCQGRRYNWLPCSLKFLREVPSVCTEVVFLNNDKGDRVDPVQKKNKNRLDQARPKSEKPLALRMGDLTK